MNKGLHINEEQKPILQGWVLLLIATLVGSVIFIMIYGTAVLDPTYIDWLIKASDLSQHYLGWCFYRQSPWMGKIGLFNTLSYPNLSSIIFTDSIPILAVLFKVLSPILPEHFQYFGLWGVLSFGLQCMIGTALFRKHADDVSALLGGILLTLTPAVFHRMFMHTALAGQWIILLSFVPLVWKNKFATVFRATMFWGVLGFFIPMVHVYFLVMCGMLLLAYDIQALQNTIEEKDRKIQHIVRALAASLVYIVGAVASVYILGGFSCGKNYTEGGFGLFSANLNSYFNPEKIGRLYPALPLYRDGQDGGFGYLGAGVLLVVALAIILASIRLTKGTAIKYLNQSLFPFMIAFCVSVFVAVIPEVAFGKYCLFTVPCKGMFKWFMDVFRANGRFIWVGGYIIAICSIAYLLIALHRSKRMWVLAICVVLQIVDLFGWMTNTHMQYSERIQFDSMLVDDRWEEIIQEEKISHVLISPGINETELKQYSIAKWATEHRCTLNNFYFARKVDGTDITYREELEDPKDDEIFIFLPEESKLYEKLSYTYEMDDLVVGMKDACGNLE